MFRQAPAAATARVKSSWKSIITLLHIVSKAPQLHQPCPGIILRKRARSPVRSPRRPFEYEIRHMAGLFAVHFSRPQLLAEPLRRCEGRGAFSRPVGFRGHRGVMR